MKYSLKTFVRNIRYLARYNLKEMDNKLSSLLTFTPTPTYSLPFADMMRDEIKNDLDQIKPTSVKDSFETSL